MKIQGPNFSKINAYKNQLHVRNELKKESTKKEDKLDISNEAKKLQVNKQPVEERKAHVQSIKRAVESGEYEIDYEKTARKMIDFWSNH